MAANSKMASWMDRVITPQTLYNHIRTTYPPTAFKDDPWSLYNAIEDFINKNGIMMTFHAPKVAQAKEVLSKISPKPKVILEFGTFFGSSAVAWGAMLKDLYANDSSDEAFSKCKVYTFELNSETAKIARDLVSLAGLEGTVTVLDGKPASESLIDLYNQGKVVKGGIDIAFYDHGEKYFLPDIKLVGDELGLFHVGSVVIADNTDYPGAPDYLEYVRKGGDKKEDGGRVKFETVTLLGDEPDGAPNAVEVSTVVQVE